MNIDWEGLFYAILGVGAFWGLSILYIKSVNQKNVFYGDKKNELKKKLEDLKEAQKKLNNRIGELSVYISKAKGHLLDKLEAEREAREALEE